MNSLISQSPCLLSSQLSPSPTRKFQPPVVVLYVASLGSRGSCLVSGLYHLCLPCLHACLVCCVCSINSIIMDAHSAKTRENMTHRNKVVVFDMSLCPKYKDKDFDTGFTFIGNLGESMNLTIFNFISSHHDLPPKHREPNEVCPSWPSHCSVLGTKSRVSI